jgi:hypothetical protein
MKILFRQDPFDGRSLALLSQVPPPSAGISIDEESDSEEGEKDIPDENGWRRVLYEENRSFPDNYTPESFLSYLAVNMDLTIYEYAPCVIATIKAVSVHASLVPIFFVVFYFLRIHRMNEYQLISVDLMLMVAGYFAREMVFRHLRGLSMPVISIAQASRGRSFGSEANPSFTAFSGHMNSPVHTRSTSSVPPATSDQWSLMDDLRRAFLVFGTVYILSPLLRTLTRSWSEDTIIAIAVTMLIVHLAFHDYDFLLRSKTSLEHWHQVRGDISRVKRAWQKVDNSQALNAIIFSAIVLASRLTSFESVFGFILFSISAFAFFPFVLKLANLILPSFYLYCVCPLTVGLTAVMLNIFVGVIPMIIYVVVLAFVLFMCPYLLVKALPLKKAFKGPWDIVYVKRKAMPVTPISNSIITFTHLESDPLRRN